MAEPTPPLSADLVWQDALRFEATAGSSRLIVDSAGLAGPSPVQALGMALAGCMAIDVVHIVQKGRLPLRGLRAELRAKRADDDPKRLVSVDLRFKVTGDVPAEKIERAIGLSREKYCSVWHSLRQDIVFTTSFEVAG